MQERLSWMISRRETASFFEICLIRIKETIPGLAVPRLQFRGTRIIFKIPDSDTSIQGRNRVRIAIDRKEFFR